MIAMSLPPLVNNYLEFCKYRKFYNKGGTVDLSKAEWLYPTTLLPLVALIKSNGSQFRYKPPEKKAVRNYLDLVTGDPPHNNADSFIPIIRSNRLNDSYMQQIYTLIAAKELNDDIRIKTAIRYIISELVANIDEHSKCNDSIFMAQNYQKLKFMEGGFFDNGITIPGSFRDAELPTSGASDSDCIKQATEGTSTKKDGGRGHGLPSTTKIIKEMNGDIFIVSGNGGLYLNGTNKYVDNDMLYSLDDDTELNGTLISFRVHIPIKAFDIYKRGYL